MLATKQLVIRTATIQDLPAILHIECHSFSPSIQEKEHVFKERIETFPDGFLMLQYGEELVGYICSELRHYQENIHPSLFQLNYKITDVHRPDGDEVFISSFGIVEDIRGYGFGRILFEAFLSHITKIAHNPRSVLLIVSQDWKEARRMSEKRGFHALSVLPHFYTPDEHGIVMRKYL